MWRCYDGLLRIMQRKRLTLDNIDTVPIHTTGTRALCNGSVPLVDKAVYEMDPYWSAA